MLKDERPLYCLNLSQYYVSHWNFLHGLRQLYQNFMDASLNKYPQASNLSQSLNENQIKFNPIKDGKNIITNNYISYKQSTQTLILQNQGSFQIKSMLMGCTSKKDNPNALGQFGQGMKLTMIVLLKAGFNLTIQSGNYIYYPTLKKWDFQYDDRVLYVQVIEKDYSDKTKVIVQKITQENFEEFRYISLALLKKNTFKQVKLGDSVLIFTDDPKLKGKLYKKGVRLDLHGPQFPDYTYNFQKLTVGRDRDCANNVWQLYELQSKLHAQICVKFDQIVANNPALRSQLQKHFLKIYEYLQTGSHQTYYFANYITSNKQFCDKFYTHFLKLLKMNQAYPKYNGSDVHVVKQLIKYGLKPQFYPVFGVSWQQWPILIASNLYKSVDTKIQQEILNKDQMNLTQEQQAILQEINNKIGILFPQVLRYQFKNKQIKNIVCYKDIQINTIFLNRFEMQNKDKLIRQISKLILN